MKDKKNEINIIIDEPVDPYEADSSTINKTIEKTSGKKKKKKFAKVIIFIIPIILLFAAIDIIFLEKEHGVESYSTSQIEEMLPSSDLATLRYPTSGVVVKEKANGKEEYLISYEGYIVAKLDMGKVEISVNNETQEILVQMPEMQLKGEIDPANVDSIPEASHGVDLYTEALQLGQKDINNKIKEEEETGKYGILKRAKKNAKRIILASIEPFIEQFSDDYSVTVKW